MPQVARTQQRRTLTASLTEQSKLNGREHQIEIWCSRGPSMSRAGLFTLLGSAAG
jgi:hypothetical protein